MLAILVLHFLFLRNEIYRHNLLGTFCRKYGDICYKDVHKGIVLLYIVLVVILRKYFDKMALWIKNN